MKLSDLILQDDIFTIIKNESYVLEVTMYDNDGNTIDLSNLSVKIVIKDLKNILEDDTKAFLKYYSNKNQILKYSNGNIACKITPEDSNKLSVTKQTKPLILSIILYNKENKIRKEYQYKLYVKQTGSNSLY